MDGLSDSLPLTGRTHRRSTAHCEAPNSNRFLLSLFISRDIKHSIGVFVTFLMAKCKHEMVICVHLSAVEEEMTILFLFSTFLLPYWWNSYYHSWLLRMNLSDSEREKKIILLEIRNRK